MGTVRTNRKGLPKDFIIKKGKNLKRGHMVLGRASATMNNLSGDIYDICYIDSKPVNMLSTLLCPMIDKGIPDREIRYR